MQIGHNRLEMKPAFNLVIFDASTAYAYAYAYVRLRLERVTGKTDATPISV